MAGQDTDYKLPENQVVTANLIQEEIDISEILEIFSGKLLIHLIETFVLGKGTQSLRYASAQIVKGLWESSSEQEKNTIFSFLMSKVPDLRSLGSKSVEFFELINYIISKTTDWGESAESVYNSVKQSLLNTNDLIFSHFNFELYSSFYKFLKSGTGEGGSKGKSENLYIFEKEPCLKCYEGTTEKFNKRQKLADIKAEQKSVDSALFYRLPGPQEIKDFYFHISEARGSKCSKEVSIFINNQPKADLGKIKNDRSLWTKIQTVYLKNQNGETHIQLPVSIVATNLMFEFTISENNNPKRLPASQNSLYNRFGDEGYGDGRHNVQSFSLNRKEGLICPRCNVPVQDSHGNCNQCGENAQQCFHCRNMNYSNFDAYFCLECSRSKYAIYDISINSRTGFCIEKILNDQMKQDSETQLEKCLIKAQNLHGSLQTNREKLIESINTLNESSGSSNKSNAPPTSFSDASEQKLSPSLLRLSQVHGESQDFYKSLLKNLINARNLRKETLDYISQEQKDDDDLSLNSLDFLFRQESS